MSFLVLKSFSQEVEIEEKDEVKYFATFIDSESGRELRLPIPKDTSEALIKFLWSGQGEPPDRATPDGDNVEPQEPEVPPEATEFGGVEDPPTYEDAGEPSMPESEDEVPSL